MVSRATPCRLNVILARDARIGLILRRGPSKWVQLIKWNSDCDTFESGQWFHGRIYEESCDVSPDGTMFIYCARKEDGKPVENGDIGRCWGAISKPPYLTALAVWQAYGAWDGGGVFLGDKLLSINRMAFSNNPDRSKPNKGHLLNDLKIEVYNPTSLPLLRLTRDGWVRVREWKGRFIHEPETELPEIWEKAHPDGQSKLRKSISVRVFKHNYSYFYSVRGAAGDEHPILDAEWADWDQRGRLVFAKSGKIFAAENATNLENAEELDDFNAAKPEPLEAPDWAKVW